MWDEEAVLFMAFRKQEREIRDPMSPPKAHPQAPNFLSPISPPHFEVLPSPNNVLNKSSTDKPSGHFPRF